MRVDGRLVCSSCVDQLPGEAQVRINQLRAVRGLASTTYRVKRAAHPQLAAFTFTTAMNLNQHRRELMATGVFDAPLLPANGAPKFIPPPTHPRNTRRLPMLIGGGVLLAIVGVGLAVTLADGDGPAKTDNPPQVEPAPRITNAPEPSAKTRTDYPAEPRAAWQLATNDPRCPMAILQAIAGEMVDRHNSRVALAEQALAAGDHRAASEAMIQIEPLPDHLLFRTANNRVATLLERIRQARIQVAAVVPPATQTAPPVRAVEPAPPVVETPIAPPPPVIVPAAVANVPPPPVPPPQTPAPATVADRFLIAANTLSELPGRQDWKPRSGDALILGSATGSLVLSRPVQGGTYQLWIQATGGTVQATLNGQRSEQVPMARTTEWRRIEPTFSLPAGNARLQVIGIGKGLVLSAVYLADLSQPGPTHSDPDPADPVEKTDPAGVFADQPVWAARFAEPHVTLDPSIEANRVPPGLPGNAGAVLESAKGKNGGRHGFTFEVTPAQVQDGGLVVLLSPRRSDRTALTVTALDRAGVKMPLERLVLGPEPWQVHTINLAQASDVHQVLIEDVTLLSTGFLLAKSAASSGAAPTASLLELRPPALLPLVSRKLDDELTFLATRRKAPVWRKSFDPAQFKMLIGHKLTAGSWDTAARKRLQEVLGVPRLPNKTIEPLVLNDGWLDALVKPSTDEDAVLDPAKHHLLIICTAGVEFPTGLSEQQAFSNFWKKLIEAVRLRGVLPVPVLGPSKVDGDDKAEVERLWNDLAGWLATKQPGIPVIDLRPAAAASADRFAPGGAKLSVDLLGDGYGTLLRRIDTLRKTGK